MGEKSSVVVDDGVLTVDQFGTQDTLIVSHFSQVEEIHRVGELERCLALGVRVAAVATPVLGADVVRREFEGTVIRHERLLADARTALNEEMRRILQPLLGPDGLPRTLRDATAQIEHDLRKYFDEDSVRSVSALVAKKVDEATRIGERRMARLLEQALDATDETTGIGKVYKSLRLEREQVHGDLTDLVAKVSALATRRSEVEVSPRKGYSFQSDVYLETVRLARLSGDSAEDTGAINGDSNRKRGDVVVTVSPQLTGGVESRFTIEVMDRSEVSQKVALKELGEAMMNRDARAAIAVLASRESSAAAGQVLRAFPDGKFICVLDKDNWNSLALEVAYCWARIETIRGSSLPASGEIDLQGVVALVDEAARHLTALEKLRTKLAVGRTALVDSEAIISELEAKLVSCLARIATMLDEPAAAPRLS